MSQQNVNVSTGRQSSSVASANGDFVLWIQIVDFFSQNFLDLLDLFPRNSQLEIIKMLQSNFLAFGQRFLVRFLKTDKQETTYDYKFITERHFQNK